MNIDKLKHSNNVALKMMEIGKQFSFSNDELKELYILGLNHDIGYDFCDNGEKHNVVGGLMLKKSGYKYWREVYYHGEVDAKYHSLYLVILNMADMQIDKYGNDVGYDERLKDISSRYGEDSLVHTKCKRLVKSLISVE